MSHQIWTTMGLILDILGAYFVAIEIVKKFDGPQTIDVGHAGTFNGSFIPKSNPKYIAYEKSKHKWMKAGLFLLSCGFVMQIIGTWVN